MSVHVHDVFMTARPEKLENIKAIINMKFNIQESVKLKKFLGLYYEWGHKAKGEYAKITMQEYVKELGDMYEKFIESVVKVN